MSTARISVIVATRDRPRLLADALASIAAQDLPPLEVRIANDGAEPVFEALEGLPLLEVVVLEAGGGHTAAARNRAARNARGEWLAFLDDDDRWSPGHLAALAGVLADAEVGLAFTDSVVVRERVAADGRRIELERRPLARDWDAGWMRHDDHVPPSCWGVRRGLFERLGGFDESFRYSEDWDFLLRAAAWTTPRRVPRTTVEVRMREGDNASAGAGGERIDCLRRLAGRHGLPELEPRTFWEVAGLLAAPAAGA
jgi:glycosyltransferase involved in cell wall biosynthesis